MEPTMIRTIQNSITTAGRAIYVCLVAAPLMLLLSPGVNGGEIPRLAGKPNLNGIWQAMNTANWNLEAHSTQKLPIWQAGALLAVPAGNSVVVEGKIPYLPEALKTREQLRKDWPISDPETSCYLGGVPRSTYMPYPFQIVQGTGDILMVYSYATSNRTIFIKQRRESPVDTWMGSSNGHWEGDTLVVVTTGFNGRAQLDRAGNHFSPALKVTERFALESPNVIRYEAKLEDPQTYSKPWTIRMPLYKHLEANAELFDYKCVPIAEELLYKDLEVTGK
jgi:hypothetical protein